MSAHVSPLGRRGHLKDGVRAWHKSSGNDRDERSEAATGDNSQNRMPQFREGCRAVWGRTINNLLILYWKSPTTFQFTWSFDLDEAWDSQEGLLSSLFVFFGNVSLEDLGILDDLYHVGCLLSCCFPLEKETIFLVWGSTLTGIV